MLKSSQLEPDLIKQKGQMEATNGQKGSREVFKCGRKRKAQKNQRKGTQGRDSVRITVYGKTIRRSWFVGFSPSIDSCQSGKRFGSEIDPRSFARDVRLVDGSSVRTKSFSLRFRKRRHKYKQLRIAWRIVQHDDFFRSVRRRYVYSFRFSYKLSSKFSALQCRHVENL